MDFRIDRDINIKEKILDGEELAKTIAQAAAEKKAADIVILEMKDVCSFTDYFVICSGRNVRQTRAIAEAVRQQVKTSGGAPLRLEGEQRGDWILMDYLSVVVHIFTPETRDFYRLEVLWKDAPRVEVPQPV